MGHTVYPDDNGIMLGIKLDVLHDPEMNVCWIVLWHWVYYMTYAITDAKDEILADQMDTAPDSHLFSCRKVMIK